MALINYGVGPLPAYRAKLNQLILRLNCVELPFVVKVAEFSKREPIRMFLRIINTLYDGWIYTLLLVFLLLRKDWRLLLVACLGVTVSFIFYFSTKSWLARIRPCDLAVIQTIPSRCFDRYSFPSGHCMTLTVVGILISWRYHAVFPILLVMVPLLCWARMAAAHHYPSDLVAGIGIGLFVAIPVAIILL